MSYTLCLDLMRLARCSATGYPIYTYSVLFLWFFFFQAEDGIRDVAVTGVQTCALPICLRGGSRASGPRPFGELPERRHVGTTRGPDRGPPARNSLLFGLCGLGREAVQRRPGRLARGEDAGGGRRVAHAPQRDRLDGTGPEGSPLDTSGQRDDA